MHITRTDPNLGTAQFSGCAVDVDYEELEFQYSIMLPCDGVEQRRTH